MASPSMFASPSLSGRDSNDPMSQGGPAPSAGNSFDWDTLMMGLALLDNAIPRGVQSKGLGEVTAPFAQMAQAKEDRAYRRTRDAKNDDRQFNLDARQMSNDMWQREKYDEDLKLRKAAQERADAAAARAEAAAGQTNETRLYNFQMKQRQERGEPVIPMEEWLKTSGTSESGLQPVYGVDANGNPVILQMNKSGKAVQTQLPEGVKISKEPIRMDAGDRFILLDPITRQQVGVVPKNLAEAERQKEVGTAQGKAEASASSNVEKAKMALDTIEKVRTHPGKDGWGALGASAGPWSPIRDGIPGQPSRGFVALVDQVKGQTFLDAFESLKGGGAVTEVEGAKATQARARLDRAQSPEDFFAALKDLEDVIKIGMDRAQKNIRVPWNETTPVAPPTAPQGGPQTAPNGPAPAVPAPTNAPPAQRTRDDVNQDLINRSRATNGQPVKVRTPEEAMKLPSGTVFETPDGRRKVVP
jgi:hypothetical protein